MRFMEQETSPGVGGSMGRWRGKGGGKTRNSEEGKKGGQRLGVPGVIGTTGNGLDGRRRRGKENGGKMGRRAEEP